MSLDRYIVAPTGPQSTRGRPRDAEATKELLLAAASEEFSEHGLAGARIDRVAPGRLLPALYVVECILFLALAALAHHSTVAVLIVLAFLDSTLAFVARVVTRSAAASVTHHRGRPGSATECCRLPSSLNTSSVGPIASSPMQAAMAIARCGTSTTPLGRGPVLKIA